MDLNSIFLENSDRVNMKKWEDLFDDFEDEIDYNEVYIEIENFGEDGILLKVLKEKSEFVLWVFVIYLIK